jgi:hypothetical protein
MDITNKILRFLRYWVSSAGRMASASVRELGCIFMYRLKYAVLQFALSSFSYGFGISCWMEMLPDRWTVQSF